MPNAKQAAMTSGNIAKQIFLFTVPIMAGNFLQQLYNTVDGIVVGQFVSESALAAIGTCGPVTFLLICLALGLSTGSGIIIAQYYGADLKKDLLEAVSTSMMLLAGLGVGFTFVGIAVAGPLMKYVLAVPETELVLAIQYLRIYCVGMIFQFIYNIVAAILRAFGDSKATLYFLLVSSGMNILLDLLFVVVFRLGVAGAAWATVISQGASAVVSVIYMFRKYSFLHFKNGTWVFSGEKCKMALRIGIPTTLQQAVISCGNIALQRLVNSFGVTFMAGYTAGTRLESYLVIPSIGFAVGVSTFTGQNIGAKNLERVRQGYRKTLLMSVVSCAVLSILVMLLRKPLVSLFGVTGESLAMGIDYLILAAPCFVFFGIYQSATGVLQGAGDVMWTMFFSLSSLALRVVLSYAFAGIFGYRILPYSMAIAWIGVAIGATIRYKREKWLKKTIVSVQ